MFVATVIASNGLSETVIKEAGARLLEAGCGPDPFCWIDEQRAADIPFQWGLAAARDALEGQIDGVDTIVQPLDGRKKKLLIADMDSTMITVECIDELADFAGIKAQIAAVTEAAMRGELDFAEALDARVALLKDLDEAAIDTCLAERVRLSPGAETLIKTMRARGALTILVSGGFTRFAEPVGEMLGFERVIANRLEIAGGKLTGTVAKPIVDSATKENTLRAAAAELGIDLSRAVAVGDGANDLPMIRAAGLGVAYRAKPIVAAAAGARLEHNDLTAILLAQGIPPSEWVS